MKMISKIRRVGIRVEKVDPLHVKRGIMIREDKVVLELKEVEVEVDHMKTIFTNKLPSSLKQVKRIK